jgi:hypothetical protein
MKLDEIIKVLSSAGRRKQDPLMVEVGLMYYGAILMNRYSLVKDVRAVNKYINMYAIILAGSGVGKDFTLKNIEKNINIKNYPEQMEKVYEFHLNLIDEKPDKDILRYMPHTVTSALEGSKEGLFYLCKSVEESRFGSVNLMSTEWIDTISSSQELLSKLKELYDNELALKVIKGDKEGKREKRVEGVVCNFVGAGSISMIDKDTRKILNRIAKTGLYRRSLVYNSNLEPEQNADEPLDTTEVIEYFQSLDSKWKDDYNKRLDSVGKVYEMDKIFHITDKAREYINRIDLKLIDRANSDKLNEFLQVDVGSLNMIVNIGYIKAYLEDKEEVELEDIKYGWSLFIKTRKTSLEVFRDRLPHNEVYELLTLRPNQTHSELLDLSDVIPKAKNQFTDVLALLQEKCYVEGKMLKVSTGAVQRYSIIEPPLTNLDKLIVSVEKDGKEERSIAFQQLELKWKDIDKLITSHRRTEIDEEGEEYTTGSDSFTLTHYEATAKTEPYGHRKADNHIMGQNMIGLDIDAGETIEQVQAILEPYTYVIYTTKSHKKAKRDYQHSFRVLLPTKTMYDVNPEQHKEMYKNLTGYFNIDADSATFNVSRLFFTNPREDCEIYHNEGELLDIQPFLPDVNANELLTLAQKIQLSAPTVDGNDDYDETESRIKGMVRYHVLNIQKGNLNQSLFKLFMFVKDLTGDSDRARQAMLEVQNIRGFPMSFIEEIYKTHK